MSRNLTPQNAPVLLAEARGKSRSELELLIAAGFPPLRRRPSIGEAIDHEPVNLDRATLPVQTRARRCLREAPEVHQARRCLRDRRRALSDAIPTFVAPPSPSSILATRVDFCTVPLPELVLTCPGTGKQRWAPSRSEPLSPSRVTPQARFKAACLRLDSLDDVRAASSRYKTSSSSGECPHS